ncbi:MAG: hypothetical protein QME88_12255 [Actinomycetota bacterium]|nr:hypothetical protein [Actinomycetota bacterium]
MGLPYETARKLEELYGCHEKEFGKVVQKLLALTFVEMGFGLAEERAVQGVDIDVIAPGGEKLSFEVKTSQSAQVTVQDKDIQGLESRLNADGYRPLFAFIFRPHYLGDGWIIVPAGRVMKGTHNAMRLASLDDGSLSREVNARFPELVERTFDDLMDCRRGTALNMLKGKYGI